MINRRFLRIFAGNLAITGLMFCFQGRAGENVLPPFTEVHSLLRSNLAGLSESELDRAAVQGLLDQLQSRIALLTNSPSETLDVPLVTKSAVLDGAFGFVRISKVAPALPGQVSRSYEQMSATNTVKGLILDLRFAGGHDYSAAARTADLFFKTERPLLRWGEETAQSTPKTAAIEVPVVILVNHSTEGAAEALAATLRQAEGALVIGSPTAGRAFLFKEYPLSNGQKLRVASGSIATGDGEVLPASGLAPDIRIAVDLEDEKAWFTDPYRVSAKPFAQSASPAADDLFSGQSTNRPRRRMNEAELVRMQREGIDLDSTALLSEASTPLGPVITDPALSRGLDLLKGLALAAKRR